MERTRWELLLSDGSSGCASLANRRHDWDVGAGSEANEALRRRTRSWLWSSSGSSLRRGSGGGGSWRGHEGARALPLRPLVHELETLRTAATGRGANASSGISNASG